MVQDPSFWRRFSVAVHNDEAAMLAKDAENSGKGTRGIKHAYVVSLSSPIDSPIDSPITTPTSTSHLSPALPPMAFTRPLSAPSTVFAFVSRKEKSDRTSQATSGTRSVYFDAEEEKPEMIALHKLPSYPQSSHTPTPSLPSTPRSAHFALAANTPPSKRASRRASRFRFALSSHPPSLPPTPKSTTFAPDVNSLCSKRTSRRFTRTLNTSRLSLGVSLSGRPKNGFRFWTTIEANTGNRDSWLESQQRKARQRTWMCWAFWMGFLVVVVGAIVTVLVLRGKGII
ncbi:hypothetical protein BU25DRAFT_184612 [Macroventuria anomochaeta]|uniref:Uncharacterized protein n=1 Tax=Macroventuria anomochaeta TaxID=301207 RepID=A0ACB6RMT1_9PLEO|nr:uncharacterized protein BU25DRAFT_184612 [Macroventuria anomochaeta]KAF2623191.1 hypothetical protein BU25DRAFT_184612 [Macroventuria anomochaeta]